MAGGILHFMDESQSGTVCNRSIKRKASLSKRSIAKCLSFILDNIAEVLLSNMPRRRCQLDLLLAVKRI
jgi:hypothetical protein